MQLSSAMENYLMKIRRLIPLIGIYLLGILILSACSSSEKNTTQGYIEARYIYIASNASGQLIERPISQGDQVKKGQLLFKLDPEPQESQLAQAEAQLSSAKQKLADLIAGQRSTVQKQIIGEIGQAEADLVLQKKKLPRYQELYKTHAIDKQTLDVVTAEYNSALEKVAQLKAKLADAQLGSRENQILAQEAEVKAQAANVRNLAWQLAQKTQAAPQAGEIFDTFYKTGEFVPAGQAVTALLTPDNIKVIFFIPEPQLSQIKLNQKISFTCDGCAATQTANISYISPTAEYTPPVIYSRSARAKLVYRVEALTPISDATKYHPGQPIDVTF